MDNNGQKLKVLVVDDDEFFRKAFISILSKTETLRSAEFIEAIDGQDAWEKVQSVTPSIALVDVIMPRMGGKELSIKLKEKFPDLPILIVTGHDDPQLKQEFAQQTKIDNYIIKPKDGARFVDEVTRAVTSIPLKFF